MVGLRGISRSPSASIIPGARLRPKIPAVIVSSNELEPFQLHPRQPPGFPVRPAHHARCLRIADDHLLLRIPGKLPTATYGDVPQMANRRGAVPDRHVADRPLPALDALQ